MLVILLLSFQHVYYVHYMLVKLYFSRVSLSQLQSFDPSCRVAYLVGSYSSHLASLWALHSSSFSSSYCLSVFTSYLKPCFFFSVNFWLIFLLAHLIPTPFKVSCSSQFHGRASGFLFSHSSSFWWLNCFVNLILWDTEFKIMEFMIIQSVIPLSFLIYHLLKHRTMLPFLIILRIYYWYWSSYTFYNPCFEMMSYLFWLPL